MATEELPIQEQGYLILEGRRTYYKRIGSVGIRFAKNKPNLNSNEIAVRIILKIPPAYFERLTPLATIELPKEAIIAPDIETIVSLTGLEVADKLQLEAKEVIDGLKELLKKKLEKEKEVTT